MISNWPEANEQLSEKLVAYRQAAPEVASAFSGLAKAATRPGAIDTKVKELMALAIGIAGRCDGCVGFHSEAALRHGASRQEIIETISVATYMGGGPSYVYGAQALHAYDQLAEALHKGGAGS